MYKKIALLILITAALASCGVGKNAASSKKTASHALQDDVIQYGRKYLGKPYRYAAKGPNAFDCSGYTSHVFRKFGYALSPSSAGQDQQTATIRRKEELSKGDLVFFEGRARNGRVGHVGIVTEVKSNGEFSFIHASTSYGVIVSQSTEQYYASRYLRGGRVIDNAQTAQAVAQTATRQQKAAASPKRTSRPANRGNAYVPAAQKKEPQQPAVPVVSVEKSEPDSLILTQSRPQETVILVQTDPLKNPKLAENASENGDDTTRNTLRIIADSLITVRTDSLDVPEPVTVEVEPQAAPRTHTVKPGETLYSISRQYNCTVEQLRQWNPQMGGVLKSGEIITIH